MSKLIVTFMLAGCLLATPVWGEYYQYTDEKGVLRFTDDITSIPPDQRPDVKTYQSVKSNPVQATIGVQAEGKSARSAASQKVDSQPVAGSWAERAQRKADALDRMQVELNGTFLALQNERAALEANAPGQGASSKKSDTYRKQVDALNAKIDRYEGQLAEYEENLKTFNAEFRK